VTARETARRSTKAWQLARQALLQDPPSLVDLEDLLATTTEAVLHGGETSRPPRVAAGRRRRRPRYPAVCQVSPDDDGPFLAGVRMATSTPSEPLEFTCHVGWLAGGPLAAGRWRNGQVSLMAAIQYALPSGRVLVECALRLSGLRRVLRARLTNGW
jgi:hypothetical protein